jgi:hypothetical protein
MEPEDIKPGIEIIVAAGADGFHKRPYRLEVTHVNVSMSTGAVTVTGRLCRLSGARTQAKRTAAVRTAVFGTAALAKIRLAREDDGA